MEDVIVSILMDSFEAENRPDPLHHDLSRARWQRSAGVIIMRELTQDAFQDVPEMPNEELVAGWKQSAGLMYRYSYEGLGLFWASTYVTSKYLVNHAFQGVHEKVNRVEASQPENLVAGIRQHTYWGTLESVMTEAENTLAHFPISLARSVCTHAAIREIDEPRFKPRTLGQVADLLDGQDMRQMVDESLLAANGFWQGFSTSINSLATTKLLGSPYVFAGDTVNFSSYAKKSLAKSLSTANAKRPTERNARVNHRTSSAGCPARYLRPSLDKKRSSTDIDEVADVFDKPIDELLVPHAESVVQRGLSYVIRGLRNASESQHAWMTQNESRYKLSTARVHPDLIYKEY